MNTNNMFNTLQDKLVTRAVEKTTPEQQLEKLRKVKEMLEKNGTHSVILSHINRKIEILESNIK